MNPNFLHRRTWLCALASAAALCAQAQTFPNKPIKMVVPYAAGGATNVLARVLGEKMVADFEQPVVIDNRAGAAGIIGTDAVAKAAPDGYTVVLSLSNSLMTNDFLYEKLPYDAQRDLVLVYQIASSPLVLVTHPSVPVKTGPELLKYVSAHKGKLAYGSYGIGSSMGLFQLAPRRLPPLDRPVAPSSSFRSVQADVRSGMATLWVDVFHVKGCVPCRRG